MYFNRPNITLMNEERWDRMKRDRTESNESSPFLDSTHSSPVTEIEPLTAKKIGNRFFGVFIAITIGVYSGLISRAMQDAWIYASLFCGESLICACAAGIVKQYNFKKSLTYFSLCFIISAISSPISCYLGFRFL